MSLVSSPKASPLSTSVPHEDVWVDTACDMCYCPCGIRVHRVNGVVTRIEGNPEDPQSRGKICAKGQAALMGIYNPKRVKKPLKRTNPDKGIGVDPKWMEISWEEALNTVADYLKEIRARDPRKLILTSFDTGGPLAIGRAWQSAFGTTAYWSAAAVHCGAALHTMAYATNATFHSEVDLDYCNYCILFGSQHGHGVGLSANINTQKMAEARRRGMKLVVVDPMCSTAAAKADEWLPIRPGTDAALALGMVNVLLNELAVYDGDFLKRQTNATYLVGPSGLYVRDKHSGKPLVWDGEDGGARPYDKGGKDPAIEGRYEVDGVPCRPAFELLKEHVKSYPLERVAEITTIPVETIRRVAKEFAQAAQVGSTIVIEGKALPYRPVAVQTYKGSQQHKHGGMAALAMQLLNLVLGAIYVPGSHRGANPVSYLEIGGDAFTAHEPRADHDGLIIPAEGILHGRTQYEFLDFESRDPEAPGAKHLFPIAYIGCADNQLLLHRPEMFKSSYQCEALIHYRNNLMMTTGDPKVTAEILKKIPFVVSITQIIEETDEFADIVLPDAHNLERLDIYANWSTGTSASTGYWYWRIRQPVVEPPSDVRPWPETLLEIADRAGFLGDVYEMLNWTYPLREPFQLDPQEKYTWEEIQDRAARSMFGPEHDLAWFKRHAVLKVKRQVEEVYPRPSLKPRIPLYYEHWLVAKEYAQNMVQELEIASWDFSDYQALPDWKPCHEEKSAQYDLWAINYKLPFHTFSQSVENPWLNELGERHPYAYNIVINSETAKRKGIPQGGVVWVESPEGLRVQGRVRVSECIHPEVIAIAGTFGHWAKERAIARGKGVHFNSLLSLDDMKHVDYISAALDSCVKVKVYKD